MALFLFMALWTVVPAGAFAQATGSLHGEVQDPDGSAVPGATVTLAQDRYTIHAQSGTDGFYSFQGLPAGNYTLSVQSQGFAPFSQAGIAIVAGQTRQWNVSLSIAVQKQKVTIYGENRGVSVNPEDNASAVVIKGSELDALSEDPEELQNQLEALAGPAAGPNGGEIYINGFTGGQLPPRSSIREIRVNDNPFSAEFDSLGYGRIEIFTKPGSSKLTGHITASGNDSDWNTANPLIAHEPGYYDYYASAGLGGPIAKKASYLFNSLRLSEATESIVDGVNPDNTSELLHLVVPNPTTLETINPRVDFQLGTNNTLTFNDSFQRTTVLGEGTGQLNLPEQASNTKYSENALQVMNSWIVNSHLVNDVRFQWRRIRSQQTPSYSTPAVTVQGAFTTGGSSSGTTRDNQDLFELQDFSTAALGAHTLNVGIRLRAYHDTNYTNAGTNGSYFFSSISQYLAGMPAQYQQTVVENPLAHLLMFDAALFYQDDWHVKPNFTFSYGLRYETQDRIHDHADWAPRLALAWAPGQATRSRPPKRVLRAGYGWFYNRFTLPGSLGASSAIPYLIQTIHDNGLNQKSYIIDNPGFYNPSAPLPPPDIADASTSIPSIYTINPRFHAALNMQGAVGADQQIGKDTTVNLTYLMTRGIHQYLTNNVTAPAFDKLNYIIVGALPAVVNYQFQSGGVYKQHEIVVTVTTHFQHLSLHGVYTFNHADSDTQGVTYVPSVAQDPSFDYGRPKFGIANRFYVIGTYSAPYGIVFSPQVAAQSGTPYNLVIGSDLTGNNQFNARPGYGICEAAGVITTPYGCLDTDPGGKGERIIPYGFGTGPANFTTILRVSKVIGIGRRAREVAGTGVAVGGSGVGGRGLSSSQAQLQFNATAPRKYNLTLVGSVVNVFNVVNLSPPNGTLNSPLFGTSQSLAGGVYGSPTSGNRTVDVSATFSF